MYVEIEIMNGYCIHVLFGTAEWNNSSNTTVTRGVFTKPQPFFPDLKDLCALNVQSVRCQTYQQFCVIFTSLIVDTN